MSYHVFPQAGREAYNPRRKFAAMAKLEPLDGRPANYALMNTGWNESTLLPLDSSRHLLPPSRWNTNWETPTTNAFPMSATIKSDLSSSSFGRPFGSTSSSGVGGMRLALHKQNASIRTPLGAISRRSEHFYSNPIHGVFSEHVEEQPERWVTSNRNVFAPRQGIPAPATSAEVLSRVASASSGSIAFSTNGYTKPVLSRLQHCWDVHEAERDAIGFGSRSPSRAE